MLIFIEFYSQMHAHESIVLYVNITLQIFATKIGLGVTTGVLLFFKSQ